MTRSDWIDLDVKKPRQIAVDNARSAGVMVRDHEVRRPEGG